MKLKKVSQNIKSLLEYKNTSYKRKYFILSNLFESNIKESGRLYEEFKCYLNALDYSDGKFPVEKDLISFYKECLSYEDTSKRLIESKVKFINKYNDLRNPINSKSKSVLINEALSGISDKRINKKLKESLEKSIDFKKSILVESEYVAKNIIDYLSMFDDIKGPSKEELAQISSEEDEFALPEDSYDVGSAGKTVEKIIQIFGPITGKDPRKMSERQIAKNLGYTGNGKYRPGQKHAVLSGWDQLERDVTKKMNPYGKNTGMSIVAKRKWWIIKSIECCLMLEKQAGYMLGLSDQEKARLSLSHEEASAVADVVKSKRRVGRNLSSEDIRRLMEETHDVLLKGNYDLNDSRIKEKELMGILKQCSSTRPERAAQFESDLNIMYPLQDTRAEFDRVPTMSDAERAELEKQNVEFDKSFEDEEESSSEDLDGKKSIEKEQAIKDIISSTPKRMTVADFTSYMEELKVDLERLGELEKKTQSYVNPDIFKPFETDSKGNIIPDIKQIPDIIPAEGLTPEETKEMEDIIAKIAEKDRITIMNYDQRGEIYDELVNKSVSVDEFMSFMKSFKLDNIDKPVSWEDIARSSYGKFSRANASRQYGVKAWLKGTFYSFSSDDKAQIYSYLAERWYDRLKQLDLIDDKSFVQIPSKTGKPEDDKVIPGKVLRDLEDKGKYKRSDKLSAISDTLEIISQYTSPKYVKRYFDEKRDDALEQGVQEKIQSLMQYADTEEEYDMLLKRLASEDKDTAAYAIMDTMFTGNSGFRIFATGMLKEYYNQVIWPGTELSLAQAVVDYFAKSYNGVIGKSLPKNSGSDEVKKEEGKELFNKIIYLVMQRTGISSSDSRVPQVGDSRAEQEAYFLGQADPRGDFAAAVEKYNSYLRKTNAELNTNIPLLTRKNGQPFDKSDTRLLLDDMFDETNGIIGKVAGQMKRLNTVSANDIITWIGDYPEAKLDQAIVLGMSLSDFYRRTDTDPMLTIPIEEIGKDTAKALSDYKKTYKGNLLSKDFVEYLDDYYGMEPIDVKSKGSKSPGGKSFQ